MKQQCFIRGLPQRSILTWAHRAFWILTLTLIPTLTEAAQQANPALDRSGDKHIIWTEVEGGLYIIYLADPDGANRHRVTTVDYRTTSNQLMMLSPDESQIVYVVAAQTNRADSSIWLVDTRTGQKTLLISSTTDWYPTSPIWSPDGEWIAYIRARKGPDDSQLWTMDKLGSTHTLITSSGMFSPDISFLGKAYSLVWLPDDHIYYRNDRFTAYGQLTGLIYQIDLQHKTAAQVEATAELKELEKSTVSVAAPAGFRLPFEGGYPITTGPSCGAHTGAPNGEAIDFGLNEKDVVASEAGVIRHYYESCGGNQIILEHDNGLTSRYAHISIREPDGKYVGKGCKVGRISGCSGSCCDGAHLHFAVLKGDTSIWIRDLPGITWYTGDINQPCMPADKNDGWGEGPTATCGSSPCCGCLPAACCGSAASGCSSEQASATGGIAFRVVWSTLSGDIAETPFPSPTRAPIATITPVQSMPSAIEMPLPSVYPPIPSGVPAADNDLARPLESVMSAETKIGEPDVSQVPIYNSAVAVDEYKLARYESTVATSAADAQVKDSAGNLSEAAQASVTAVLNVELPSSASYRIARSVLGMGGGAKTSASYRVQGTSGQLSGAGVLAGSSYQVRSGFWAGVTCPLAELAAAPDISIDGAIVTLEWDAVAGVTSYRIYRGTEPYFVLGTPYDTTSNTTWTDSDEGDTPPVNHTYVVKAVNGCSESSTLYRVGEFKFALTPGN